MGYVYKFTNRINNKWYIGSHNGTNENYQGSGTVFKLAKEKYGIDNFTKEILYFGEDYRNQEKLILIECNAKDDPLSYNLKNEAIGGAFYGKDNGMYGKAHTKEAKIKMGDTFRGKKRPAHSEKMTGKNNPMYNNHHTDETKKKISNKNLGREWTNTAKLKQSKILKGKKHNLKEVVCPHCNKIGKGPNMTRYHFNNCKELK